MTAQSCPTCASSDIHSLQELHRSDSKPADIDTAPPRKRTSPRVKLLYAVVLVASWSIVPLAALYFISVSYIRYHLEMPWILRLTDMQLSIPAIVLIVCLIALLRYVWVRCTTIIAAETRWNSDNFPVVLKQWERTRLCKKCSHRWVG